MIALSYLNIRIIIHYIETITQVTKLKTTPGAYMVVPVVNVVGGGGGGGGLDGGAGGQWEAPFITL